MTNKTLIVYATKMGATQETAQTIANILKNKYGLQVDLLNLNNSSLNLSAYQNIVIGTGVRMGKWYKEAQRFLNNDFEGKTVAVFVSSFMRAGKGKHDEAVAEYLDKVLGKSNVKAVAVEAFGGVMRFFGNTGDDNRDAGQIEAWAEKLGSLFQTEKALLAGENQ